MGLAYEGVLSVTNRPGFMVRSLHAKPTRDIGHHFRVREDLLPLLPLLLVLGPSAVTFG